VPAEPDPDRPYISLSEAAQRLGLDRRTLLRALASGRMPGWARPGPDNLRWFVYGDALNARLAAATGAPSDQPAADTDQERIARLEAENAELRARLSNAAESNLLLMAAHEDLTAAAALQSAATDKYRQALGLYMTPDNVAGIAPNG
jgi:excisionase family DNA binding protein